MTKTTTQKPYPRRVWLRAFLRFLLRILLFFLCKVTVHGRENLPQKGPYLLIANHFHYLDPPFVIHATAPIPLEFLGGAIFADPPFYITWIPKIWGIYEVVRGGASMEAMRAAGDVLDQDGFLCIFPEAGSWASVLRPARPGTALIAVQNHVPLIPIALTGVEDVIPSWKRWRRGHVTVRIGRPFGPFTAEGRGRQRRAQLEEIGEKIMRELAELLPPEKHGVFSDDPVLRAEAEEVAEYPFHDWMG